MESPNCFLSPDGFLIVHDTSQPPNSPARYLSAPSQNQYYPPFLTQNQQHFSQFSETPVFLVSLPAPQPFIGLQQHLPLEATSQSVVPSQDIAFLPSNCRNVRRHNVANYAHNSLLHQTPSVDNSVDDSFVATGVELSSTTINPFARASVPFSTSALYCEPQSSSNGSSPSTHATPSQDFESESAYVSPYATSSFEPAPGECFGYLSNAEQLLTPPVCLPNCVDSTIVHSSTDTSNYLDSQGFQAHMLDDEISISTARPIGVMTPVHDYLNEFSFCTPTEASVRDSPTPVIGSGADSQEHKRKQPPQDDDQVVAKRRKTKSQTGENVGNEKLEVAMERNGEPALSVERVFHCPDCASLFVSQKELDSHGKKKHGRYACILNFSSGSGCEKRFSKSNEWKRHCMTQHIVQDYYVCPILDCQDKKGKDKAGTFLRKDLLIAHLARCHTPDHVKEEHRMRQAKDKIRRDNLILSGLKAKRKSAAQKNADDDDDKSLTGIPFPKIPCSLDYRNSCQEHQELTKKGRRSRVTLPTSIRCNFQSCDTVFEGDTALNKYLEHVAKYLDGVTSSADDFQFGLTLVPYFTGIGILKAKEGTSGDNLEWELITEAKDMIVSPEYLPG